MRSNHARLMATYNDWMNSIIRCYDSALRIIPTLNKLSWLIAS